MSENDEIKAVNILLLCLTSKRAYESILKNKTDTALIRSFKSLPLYIMGNRSCESTVNQVQHFNF